MSTIFGEYKGPGIYHIGLYGINLTSDLPQLMKALKSYEGEDEDSDEIETNLDYDTGQNATAYIEKLDKESKENNFEDVYKVIICELGEDIHWQQSPTKGEEIYYGTDHSIFGSGNVHLKIKGKIKFKWE